MMAGVAVVVTEGGGGMEGFHNCGKNKCKKMPVGAMFVWILFSNNVYNEEKQCNGVRFGFKR